MAARAAHIDRIDVKILTALQKDGRVTNRDLADRVGLSPSACHARVRRLERAGLIRGYHADIAADALGHPLVVYAQVSLAQHRPEDFALFDRTLADFPEIVEAAQVSGVADYVLKAVVPDIEGWGRINDALLDRGIRIEAIKTSVVMKVAKRFTGLPLSVLVEDVG